MDLHATMTDKRRQWLELLEVAPGTTREGFGIVPFQCWKLGWSQWSIGRDEGTWGEELTDEGRRVLCEVRRGG